MVGRRAVLSAAAVALLLSGCTNGGHGDDEATQKDTAGKGSGTAGGPTASGSASASPSASSRPYTLAEAAAPKTRAEAVAFVRGLAVQPDYFGPGYRRRDPYEQGPTSWAVLGEDCLWRREALPSTVLASLTRSFVRPGTDGTGAVYVSLTVTVHISTREARRDMASSLDEPLRCPQERLNATDTVQKMTSRGDPFDEQRNATTDDDLTEFGQYVVDGDAKPRRFDWFKHRLGPVTVAATVRHAAGESDEEQTALTDAALTGVGYVTADVDRYGRDLASTAPSGTPSTAPSTAPSTEVKGAGDE
ncbi:hypothetical protein [Streptomyces hyaluromycini]|uniref:hypothetical protein n=1 Tax=Streptomyces hyaluromycini TaxID=1377993 RepID=UPI001237F9F1|nr:hypothetical protein [Streptomyces hyaluromycini]